VRAKHLGAGPDDDAVKQCRVSLARIGRCPAQSDALIKRDVVADLRGLADHDPGAMVDKEPPPDGRAGVNFDPGDHAR
jgi:hypothetical protein